MSGWIKVEKDLESDPRVLRMAKELCRQFLFFTPQVDYDPSNASALPGVTLVCGALTRLWIYADSHARGDDTLDMSTTEIDEWLGIPNFCSMMPKDWLVILDDCTVELPGYQEHNGTEARKRALTQKRVAQHRSKEKRISVTPRNASALPDQTKTKTIEEASDAKGADCKPRKPSKGQMPDGFSLTAELSAYVVKTLPDADPAPMFEKFCDQARAKAWTYADWPRAFQTYCRNAHKESGHFAAGQYPKHVGSDAAWR